MKRGLAFLIFLIAGKAHATPAISSVGGSMNELSTITISGSGFLTYTTENGFSHNRSAFLPAVFKDFEDGLLDSDRMAREATWGWAVRTDGTRTGSTSYAHRYYDSSGGSLARISNLRHRLQSADGPAGVHYISFWFQTPDQDTSSSGKFFRFFFGPASALPNSKSNLYLSTGRSSLTGSLFAHWGLRGFSESNDYCEPSPVIGVASSGGNRFLTDQWSKVEIYMDTSKGELTTYKDGNRTWTRRTVCAPLPDKCKDECYMSPDYYSPTAGSDRGLMIGHMVDNPTQFAAAGWPYPGNYYFDDIYMSYTPARVEICDQDTWAEIRASTVAVCETQIPLTWGNSQIQVSLNKGAFGDGTTAYMYVLSENSSTEAEDVNPNGHPVVWGGTNTGDQIAPVVSNVVATPSITSFAVSWNTDEVATSQVQYGASASYGSNSALSSALVMSHSVVVSGLSAGTTYHYRVRSADAASNTGTSSDATVVTLPSIVTEAPPVVTRQGTLTGKMRIKGNVTIQ